MSKIEKIIFIGFVSWIIGLIGVVVFVIPNGSSCPQGQHDQFVTFLHVGKTLVPMYQCEVNP